jgi:HAD superfamily hydrolase (TIGR01549 family)
VKRLPLQALCFDLGSTLWDDYPTELHHWGELVHCFARHGIETTLPQLVALSEQVVHTFSPSLTRSMVWRTVGGDMALYQQIIDELVENSLALFRDPDEFRRLNPLFPGVHELLESLAARYPLAVISQNFAEAEQWMEWHGIAGYFQHVSLSIRDKLFKPDPRLYVYTCEALGVDPAQALMVGDRLDNDIWPANRLKMHTVRVLAAPYRIQQPRYHPDVPDFTVEQVAEVAGVVAALAGG